MDHVRCAINDFNCSILTAPPYILIADYRYLRQMNLDGSNYRSILNFGYIHSMDFDYRCVITVAHYNTR